MSTLKPTERPSPDLGKLRRDAALAQQRRDSAECVYMRAKDALEAAKREFQTALQAYQDGLDVDLAQQAARGDL